MSKKKMHAHPCNSQYSYAVHATVACTELSIKNEKLEAEVRALKEKLRLAKDILTLGDRKWP